MRDGEVFRTGAGNQIRMGDSLRMIREHVEDGSVDAIITDPPYNTGGKFIGRTALGNDGYQSWDDFASADHFLEFISGYLSQFKRVLKPNGSVMLFSSPVWSSRIESLFLRDFNVLNSIVWHKPHHGGGRQKKSALRRFWNGSERIIFAEKKGLRARDRSFLVLGDFFKSIIDYLRDEWQVKGGFPLAFMNSVLGNRMGGHYTGASQFVLIPEEQYNALRDFAHTEGKIILERDWASLREEYEHLLTVMRESEEYRARKKEYDDSRRFFSVSADVPWDDVWTFPVAPYGKAFKHNQPRHPCEKPVPLLEHMVSSITRPGDVILDAFSGSGSVADAAIRLGRRVTLFEADPAWCDASVDRIRYAERMVRGSEEVGDEQE